MKQILKGVLSMKKLSDLKERLCKLEREEFMLQMIDHWSESDYDLDRKLTKEIREVKSEIQKLEGGK